MSKKINKKGFTLTEILATIAILGIIVAIAVPSYNALSKKFEKEYYKSLEGSILSAAKSYYKDNQELKPEELLYSNVVTFSQLKQNKNIDDIKFYKSEDDLKGRIIIVKKVNDYDYKICYLASNTTDESSGTAAPLDDTSLEKLNIDKEINRKNCDSNWLKNDVNTFATTYGNNEKVYLYYQKNTDQDMIKNNLSVNKKLCKNASTSNSDNDNENENCLDEVDITNEKFYPQNITAIDLSSAVNGKAKYTLKYQTHEKEITRELYVYRYDAPSVTQNGDLVELNWNVKENEEKVGNLKTSFSSYQYREKTCDNKWDKWNDISNDTHSFSDSSNSCDGIVTAQFRWRDKEKNISMTTEEVGITLSSKKTPTLTIESLIGNEQYNGEWTNKNVTIRLTATDLTETDKIVNKRNDETVDNLDINDNKATKDIIVSENTKTAEKEMGTEYDFRLRDKDGKDSLPDVQYIKIDKTNPLVDVKVTTSSYKTLYSYSSTGSESAEMEWTNVEPAIYFNVFVKDELSGIKDVKIEKKLISWYTASGVTEQSPDEYSSISAYKSYAQNGYTRYLISISSDMYDESIKVTVTDNAGNQLEHVTKIKYDKTPPSVIIEYTSINVVPICFDNIGGSGKDKIYYKTSANGDWNRYVILARNSSVQRYYAKCTDKAGNSSETSEPNNSTTTQTYSISFNSNGGTGSMNPITNIKSGETKTLTKNTFTKEGYTFAGWSTSSGSSTVKYTDGAQVKVTSSIQLYAVWKQKEVKTFTVTFNHLKATWMSQTNTTKSCQTTGNSCQIKLENLTAPSGGNQRSQSTSATIRNKGNNPYSNLVTVVGWNTNSNGTGTKYEPNKTITISSNMTLYAIVKINKTRFYAFPNEDYGLYCRKSAGLSYAKQNFQGMIITNSSTAAYYNSTNWQYTGGKMWFVGNVDPSNLCSGGSLGVGTKCTSCWVPGDWVDW